MVRFTIDEHSVNLSGLKAEDARSAFIAFLECIREVDDEGHGVCYDEDLFNANLRGGRTFWQLFDPDSDLNLDHDFCEWVVAAFGMMPRWYELGLPQPVDVDVQIAGGSIETTGSVAWAHAQSDQGLLGAACICAPHGRSTGLVSVRVGHVDRPVWFVGAAKDVEHYFRYLLERFADSPDDFDVLASFAFRNLLFVDDCFSGIKKMSKRCRELAPVLVAHLSAFSDEGQRIFSGLWRDAPTEFGAFGVDISDENGKTKADAKAAKQRMRIFKNSPHYFWWHSKLERDRDRIHIYPDYASSGGKIIVGIFCQHLK